MLFRKLLPDTLREMLTELLGTVETFGFWISTRPEPPRAQRCRLKTQFEPDLMPLAENISAAATQGLRWLRRCLTVDALRDGLNTAAWVAPLTILIWVYADEEMPANDQEMTVQVELHCSNPDRVVTLKNPHDVMIVVDIAGSKSAIDALTHELNQKSGENPTVRIDLPANTRDGPYPLTIADKVRSSDIFSRSGVSVVKVSPEAIDVDVDTLKTVVAEVKPSPGAPLIGTPVFEPQTVHLTAPAHSFPLGSQALVVYAQIPTTGEYAKPGSQQNVPLPLTLPFTGEHVSVNPSTVSGTYMVKQNDVSYSIESISVRHSFSAGQGKRVSSGWLTRRLQKCPGERARKIKSRTSPSIRRSSPTPRCESTVPKISAGRIRKSSTTTSSNRMSRWTRPKIPSQPSITKFRGAFPAIRKSLA